VLLRCLLVDDNDAFLKTASVLLERQGVTVAGVASTIAEADRGKPRCRVPGEVGAVGARNPPAARSDAVIAAV
jgi:hypothetical protein